MYTYHMVVEWLAKPESRAGAMEGRPASATAAAADSGVAAFSSRRSPVLRAKADALAGSGGGWWALQDLNL